jgi:hypothetical protein
MGAQMQSVVVEAVAKRFYNFEQAMVYTGASEWALRWAVREGDISFIKRKRKLYFEVSELDRYFGVH